MKWHKKSGQIQKDLPTKQANIKLPKKAKIMQNRFGQ